MMRWEEAIQLEHDGCSCHKSRDSVVSYVNPKALSFSPQFYPFLYLSVLFFWLSSASFIVDLFLMVIIWWACKCEFRHKYNFTAGHLIPGQLFLTTRLGVLYAVIARDLSKSDIKGLKAPLLPH